VTIGYPDFPTFGIELNTPNPTKIYGFEAQLQAAFGDWSVYGNLGWLHSDLGDFYATDPRLPSVASCDPASGPQSATCRNLGGTEQTYAPKLTFNVGVQRTFHVGRDTITPRINYAHIGGQWATLFENEALGDRIGSRNLLGAQVDWAHGSWLTTLYGTNLSNQHYIGAINSGLRFAGFPRQYGIRATYFFQ
jgi:iron complex outermembrane receptor protein